MVEVMAFLCAPARERREGRARDGVKPMQTLAPLDGPRKLGGEGRGWLSEKIRSLGKEDTTGGSRRADLAATVADILLYHLEGDAREVTAPLRGGRDR